MFSCEICGHQSKQKANLIQHKRNKHDIDIIWYKCDLHVIIYVNNRLH